ncbi:hypothetical protein KI387_005396, partial [Taxus chinensis]
MANMAVRLRRCLAHARAFSTTKSHPSSSWGFKFIPKEPLACYQSWDFNRFLTPSEYFIARRMVSNSRPVHSPVDTDRTGRNFRGDTEILFEGCDYEHWLITMEFPDPQPTREEKIDTFIKTLAKVVGSEEEAKKRIYALSTTTYTGFQAQISEETSEKMKGIPGVVWVLPDSYIDPVNKEYGGDKYINGVIIPDTRVYNNRPSGRYNDRPRNRMRRDFPVERRDGIQRDGTDYRPPMEGRGPIPGGDPQGYRQPLVEGRGSMPVDRQDYRPPPMDGRGPPPPPPMDGRGPPPLMDGRGSMPGDRQDYRPPPMDGRGPPPPMDGRGSMPGDRQDY